MKPKKLNQLEPCPCGGRLVLIGTPNKDTQQMHLVIKCKKCGAWYGGFTYKYKDKKERRAKK